MGLAQAGSAANFGIYFQQPRDRAVGKSLLSDDCVGQNHPMPLPATLSIRRVAPSDVALLEGILTTFGEAFADIETYSGARPSAAYLEGLLSSDSFIAIAALKSGTVVGGLAAYELKKFEQERSEIYIYDLAVASAYRRNGIATALIRELQGIATERGAYVIYVQADKSDPPAIALYSKLGAREEVLHFDIPPSRR